MNDTIYILHGWAIDAENEKKWQNFRLLLEEKGFKTVFLPIPGLTTELQEVWSLDTYVLWLSKELPNEPVILLGHSFGGQIASRFTAQNNERVKKLILIDSAGMIDRSLKKVLKRVVFGSVAKVGKLFFKHELLRKLLYKLAREQDYLNANPTQRQTMANVISTEVIDDLGGITCPTVIIWGRNDMATPVQFADMFHSKIKGSKLHIIDDARHSPQFTHAVQTVQIIGDFLK